MTGRNQFGAGVQAYGAARVTEPAPLPDRVGWACGGECGGLWPPLEPRTMRGKNPADRSLLEHDLTDQDRPGGRARPAPRQVSGVRGVPAGNDRCVVNRHQQSIFAPRGLEWPRRAESAETASHSTGDRPATPRWSGIALD